MSQNNSKNFEIWMKQKGYINARTDHETLFFREREIWWCFLGLNVGFEEDGKGKKYLRPILILKKFNGNSFIGLPLTTVDSDNRYVLRCDSEDCIFRKVILSQLKMIDSKRLMNKISIVSLPSFTIIRKAVRNIF